MWFPFQHGTLTPRTLVLLASVTSSGCCDTGQRLPGLRSSQQTRGLVTAEMTLICPLPGATTETPGQAALWCLLGPVRLQGQTPPQPEPQPRGVVGSAPAQQRGSTVRGDSSGASPSLGGLSHTLTALASPGPWTLTAGKAARRPSVL